MRVAAAAVAHLETQEAAAAALAVLAEAVRDAISQHRRSVGQRAMERQT